MPGAVVRRPSAQRLGRLGRNRPFTPIPTPPPQASRASDCCDEPKIELHEGSQICMNCGTQISEQNIVAEVTFGETATGAATVQGGFISESARHAKTLGAAASRRIGGQYQSREETEQNGRTELRQLCPTLGIPPNVEEVAFNLWKLAAAQNFIQGRRTPEVAGVCLYAACRRDKHNTILLMDISEALAVNVFKLGDIYKELSRALYLEVHSHVQPVVEIEPLLMKYCMKLEFGDKTRQVAEDAARIVKRMKRDWMVTGRNPSGLCGACIVLAARMNNFRRTVREVVYVVKVSEITVGIRLSEFKKTRASTMSVAEFREKGHRVKHQHDPPAMSAADDRRKRLDKIREGREARSSARSSMAPSQGSPSPSLTDGSSQASTVPATQTQRRDADGFAIPALPNTLSQDGSTSISVLKPRKRNQAPVIKLTEADFAAEHELQADIENILQDPNCVSARNDTEREKLQERSILLAKIHREASSAATSARLASQGRSNSAISDDPEISPSEFDSDPEVMNAILPEAAVKVKETIWLRDNEDWLRQQQAKFLKQELEKADGGKDKRKKKRKRSRMGDGSVLTESGTPVQSPADAAQRMLEKRGGKNISKSINYAMLNKVFGGDVGPTERERKRMKSATPASDAGSDGAEDAPSRAGSAVPASPSPAPVKSLKFQHEMVQTMANAADRAQGRVDRVRAGIKGEPARPGSSASSAIGGAEAEPAPVVQPVVVPDNADEEEDDEDDEEEEEEEDEDEEIEDDDNDGYGSPAANEDADYEDAQGDMDGDFGLGGYDD